MGKGLESAQEAWTVLGFLILYELSLPSVPFPFLFTRPPPGVLGLPLYPVLVEEGWGSRE